MIQSLAQAHLEEGEDGASKDDAKDDDEEEEEEHGGVEACHLLCDANVVKACDASNQLLVPVRSVTVVCESMPGECVCLEPIATTPTPHASPSVQRKAFGAD